MALDRDAYFSYVDDLNRKAEEQAARAAEEARPFSEKAWNAAAGALDAAGGVLGEVGEGFVSSAARARDAYGRFWDARRASNEPRHVFMSRPDVQEAVDDLESAAVDFVMAPVKVFADHTLAPARSYVAGRIDAAADEGGEVAQNLRATETFVSYFMTPEDKLRKAREVEEDTGIPADAFLDDAALYKEALRIHDYTLRKKALMQDAFSMEAVFEEFPEIRAVAEMSPKDAALALHDIESVRQTHGIVESFTHFLEVGNRKLEYDNLQYKMATGTADENDRQRAADLEKLSDSDKKRLPSFFDDPLAMAAGGLASSAPEMLDSLREGVRDGLLTAEAAAIAGAAAGTAVEPVGGTLAGGALGAGGGFVAGFARSAFGSAARRAMVRTAMTRGMQAGMFEGMRRPESGARYAEYGEMKDKEGNPLLSEDERRLYAVVGGAANAAIEMWNAGLFAKPLRGLNLFGREGGYGADAIRAVIDRAKYDAASRESVAFFAKEQVKDVLKIAVTESLEEGAQSLADDLIHNEIVDAADGRAADEAISPGDMAVRALVRTAEAFPVGVGFGLAAPLGSAGAVLRHARRLSSEQAREEAQVQHTLTGTVMLDGLQQVSSSAKLKQTAPDVQQEIIRAQVQGSGFEAAYVDTVAALQSPEGAEDLEAVARAAGISDEELSETIAREGLLYVPVEKYAQSAASPALLEAVSFSPEADSIARMKMNARALTDAMEKAQKDAIKARTQAVHAIVNAWFPEAPVHADEKEKLRRDADREMAVAAITQDPDSPAHGWRALYDAFTVERDALLHPALDALARGMKKGVDILQNGPDGRGIRVSNNAPWYQEFYAAHGRAPRKDELMELAYLLTVGDVSAPKVEGWMPSSQEAADAMEAARGQLDELNAHIGTLSNIKDRMMQLDAAEVRATQGLTPEAYGVYHAVMAKLREIGGVQAQAARMNALLFAARADAVARVMREKGGRPDYTARDYFDAFVLRDGGKYVPGGFEQRSSSRRLKEDMLAWKQKVDDFFAGKLPLRNNVMMRSPLVFDLIGADSSIPLAIDSKILQKLVDKHHFTRKELLRLPEKLADPLFVLRALGNNGVEDKQKRIVVIDMQINGATVMVPFVMNTGQGFNKIASAYGREKASGVPNDQWYMNRLDQANLLYINKKRTDRWVAARTGAAGSHNAPLAIQSLNNISVPNETDLGKLKKARPGFYQEMHDAVSSEMAGVSADQKLEEDAAAWEKQVDEFMSAADKNSMRIYRVMDTPLVFSLLNQNGFHVQLGKELGISHAMLWKVLREKEVKGVSHGHALELTPEMMKELPRALADPMMILRNRRGDDPNAPILPDEIIAVVDTKDKDGSTIIVPIVLKEQNGRYMLKTFFGKRDVTWFQKRMMLGDVLYAHKKRALSWVKAIQRHQSPGRFTLQDSFFHSIPTDEDLVKLREEYPGFYQRAWHGSPYEDAVSSQMAAVRKQYEGTPQWMMAPNGKPTNLTEEEWLAVRTPAFKAAFGDWEQVAQRQRYLNTAPIEVAEKQIVKSEGVTVMEAAFRWAAAHLPVQVATPFGTVEINRASVKDSLGHGFSQKKLDAVTSLPEGMKVAAFIGEEQDFGGADINNGYFCYPIMYQGEKQVVFVRARRDVNSNKLYVHEVWTEDEIKDIPLQTAAKFLNSKPHGGNVLYKSILAEFLHGDKGVSPNLLDENGEPLPSVLSSRHNQEQQRAIYGEFSKENGKKIITLFAGANPSTMLHEMGHMFLDDLDELAQFDEASAKDLATVNEWAEWHEGAAKEYENTPWAEEFRAHEAAIRDALKSGDAIALRAARNRWRHERFARGFELYLYEGKASSKALRGVFRRFKQLLRRIYQFVKDVGGKPSPEVEAVMARMIASEEEIKAAELDERWRPVEKMGGKEALDDLLGDDVADTYAKWLEEARRDAEDILRARVMKNLEKEARAEFKERVEEERERKRVQLENEPVYLAEAAIRAQGDERAALLFFPSVEAYKEERAKRKSPEEELQDAMEVFAKGLDEELMAAALSDENVARAMQTPEAYHRRVAIEREALRAKERLARYVGGAPKEEDAAPAQEEGTGKEAEGTQEERRRAYEEAAFQNARYLRAEARRLLAESPISESCNPEFFRRKERSHARAAARAAAQGRWDEALSAKDAQALAAACAYEAAKNASKVDALKKDVQKKLGARTVRLAPNERYWLHHIAYLLGLKSSDAEKPVDGKSLSALFDEYRENNDVDAADPSDLLELITQKKRSYTAMRLGDFADVVDALRILYTIGRDRNRMKSVAGKTVEEVCDEMMADPAALRPEGVVEHPVSEDTGGLGYSELLAKVPGIGEVIARLTQKGALPLLKPEIMIRLLGEKAHGYLYGTYERAQMRESELIGEKSEALDEIFSVYSRKERMGWKERNIDAHGDMLSKENVLCLALNWGTETNRKRVMDDIGQRMDVPRTLREHMTERDWKVVQEVWDLIDTFWEESARTEEELNGAHLGKVPAAAFTIETADGHTAALRGGYYPIRYNPKKSARVNDKDVEAQAKNRMTGAQVFGTKRSHTKARSEGDVVLPVRLEFAVLQEHLYNAAHNIAFRIAARDVYRVMNNKGFEQYVCARYGRPVYDYLKQWTVDVWAIPADGSDAAMDALSRAMAAFRRNSTMAIMGWRMWPVLENVSNIGPVMDRLGAREALRAVLAFVRSPRALIRRARKSIFMADRMNNMERDLRRDPHIFDPTFSVLEFLRDNAYRPLVFTDLMLSIPTWNSAYERAFPEAMAEIRRENEENRRTYEAAQEDVNRLRAEVYDLRQESAALRDEMEKRKAPVPAAMQGSRYAGLSDAELSAEEERVREAFAAKEKEFYEAGLRLERAGELPILDEKERIKEAELRAVQVGDAAVRDTFGSGQTKDLSAIQRSRSELTKMFTSFYSFFNTQFNALAESYFKGKYAADGWAHVRVWMPLARSVLCRMVLVMIIGAIGKAVLGLDGDGERDRYRMVKDPKSGKMVREEVPWEERFMKVLGRNVLSTATGLTPVVRDLSGFVSARIFDGQTSGRNFELGSVAARGLNQVEATVDLMIKMGKQELEREEKEEAERARLRKMSPKERRRYEEEKKYRKPKKEVGVLDVMRSGAQAVSTFTAARTGVTNTLSDGLFSLLQYAEDMMESDNYYDPDVRNVLRAVFFDKKLRPKEVPPKPEKPKRGKARRGGSERSGR